MILPFGPMISPILSTGIFSVMIRGANGDISPGSAIAPAITPRIVCRASCACCNAAPSTDAGMPVSFVSSCSAVTNSGVPATLKSMSPNASSAPRMSVRVTKSSPSLIRPIAMSATGARNGTPAAIGESAVPDLAPLRRTHAAGLTGAVRREVVVVHVALARLRVERVDHLLHAQHVERCDVEDLRLATLEQRRPVHAGHDVDLRRQRADVLQPAAVDAHALADDALADQLLRQ